MSSGRDDATSGPGNASGGRDSGGGDSGALPPQAPAYDFRTGAPLDKPRDPLGDGSSDEELGIWAPGQSEPETDKGSGYDAFGDTGAAGTSSTYGQAPTGPTYGGAQYGQVGYSQPSYTSPGGGPTGVPTQVPQPGGPGQPPYPGYGAPGTAPTLAGPGPGGGPQRPRSGLAVLGGIVGVLVVVVAVLVTVLLVGGSDDKEPVSSTGSAAPGASTAPSGGAGTPSKGTTGSSGTGSTGGSSGSSAARATFVNSVDGILTESASGRAQVASAVNGVNNGCSVSPSSAASTMQQVIDNRESVLAQANALDAPDPATAAVKANLVQALEASIEANRGYLQWFEDLQSEFPDDSPAGCPAGSAPQNISYDEATAASGRATTSKQAFVAGYNPLATAAGQRTWTESEF